MSVPAAIPPMYPQPECRRCGKRWTTFWQWSRRQDGSPAKPEEWRPFAYCAECAAVRLAESRGAPRPASPPSSLEVGGLVHLAGREFRVVTASSSSSHVVLEEIH